MQEMSLAFPARLASSGGENASLERQLLQTGQRRKNRKCSAFVSEWTSVSG